MAKSKSDKKVESKGKTADKKAAEKKAVKALLRAEKAVQEAHNAVADSRKELRKLAADLAKQTKKLSEKHKKAVAQLDAEVRKAVAGAAGASAKPSVSPPKDSEPHPFEPLETLIETPPLPSPQPAAPTLIELRTQAKERNITGYSRLNKAALIAALETSG